MSTEPNTPGCHCGDCDTCTYRYVATLTKKLDRLVLALSPTSMEKEAIADQIVWRSSKADFVTDVIAILRARAGIDDRLRELRNEYPNDNG